MTELENLAKELTYLDVKSMIHGEVNKYTRGKHIRPALSEELISEAHVAFMKAYTGHDTNKGALTTKLWWELYGRFKDALRKEINRDNRLPTVEITDEYEIEDRDRKSLVTRLLEELGEDAKEIVYAVIEQPVPLSRGPVTAKKRLTRWFLNLGWTRQRIARAFAEIGEALS